MLRMTEAETACKPFCTTNAGAPRLTTAQNKFIELIEIVANQQAVVGPTTGPADHQVLD